MIFGRLKMKKVSKILLLMVVGMSFISGKVFPRITEKEIIERLTRLEEGQKSILREMNQRFEDINKRFEDMNQRFEDINKRFEDINKRFDNLVSVFIGIVGAFTGIVAITIGFAIWDRKTALAPAIKTTRQLEERERKIEEVLREFAKQEPRLANVMRNLGFL
jgi:DNA repair exonuclease SbcCD ATPase subunit